MNVNKLSIYVLVQLLFVLTNEACCQIPASSKKNIKIEHKKSQLKSLIDIMKYDDYYKIYINHNIVEIYRKDTVVKGNLVFWTSRIPDSLDSYNENLSKIYYKVDIEPSSSSLILEILHSLDSCKVEIVDTSFQKVQLIEDRKYFTIEKISKQNYYLKSFPMVGLNSNENNTTIFANECINKIEEYSRMDEKFKVFQGNLQSGKYGNGIIKFQVVRKN